MCSSTSHLPLLNAGTACQHNLWTARGQNKQKLRLSAASTMENHPHRLSSDELHGACTIVLRDLLCQIITHGSSQRYAQGQQGML